jgi:muramoyltetrapeptide carboxypeptidase LdcA involved in peptidoglycan recycling
MISTDKTNNNADLKHFRFSESVISWVKTLYSDIQTCVMNNGWVSENFKNSRETVKISFISLAILLPRIINEDQTGYVKNRFIGFNLRQIQDIIDYAGLYKIEGAIIFIELSQY